MPKIPEFFREDPALWFSRVEATFRNARIVDEQTKVDFIVGALDFEVIASFKDFVTDDDVTNPYRKIKNRVISAYAASSERRLRQLLKGQVLTDGKQSHILCRLRNLNDNKCDDAIIKSIFLDQVPGQTRAIHASSNVVELQELAELADQIMDGTNSSPQIATVAEKSQLDRLNAEVAALSARLNRLATDT
ncbi:PREDICTED: uncharacterized protein LOC107191996 [Dufourea novaeangliae]|nr:PREDICTED: uncharacterized protein LOC107191996 [Dufourea novaeangliae]